jgi:hypothetical protein
VVKSYGAARCFIHRKTKTRSTAKEKVPRFQLRRKGLLVDLLDILYILLEFGLLARTGIFGQRNDKNIKIFGNAVLPELIPEVYACL